MSHPEQLGFFRQAAKSNAALIHGGRILEVGSYDVNGSIRSLFSAAAEYVGLDLETGPGVDVVEYGHKYSAGTGSFDAAVSGECFEHDPFWRDTLANMVRLTRPGGLVAFSCASRGRPEHGTKRTTRSDSPGTQSEGLNYYRNLTEADFQELPLAEWFGSWRFWYIPTSFDLYFAGCRAGGSDAVIPNDAQIRGIRELMPIHHKIVRLPLRLLARTRLSEQRYQRLVLPYWQTLLRFGPQHLRR